VPDGPRPVTGKPVPPGPTPVIDPTTSRAVAAPIEKHVEPPAFAVDDLEIVIDPTGKRSKAGTSPLSFGKSSKKPVAVAPERSTAPVVTADDSPGRVRFKVGTADELRAASVHGASGLVFRVGRADGLKGASKVAADIDLSAWVKVYGLDWLYRAQVSRIPMCVLTTPDVAECGVSTPVVGSLDVKTQVLSVELDVEEPAVPVGGAGKGLRPSVVPSDPGYAYQIENGIAGPNGNWGATSTWTKGAWSATGNTGSFNWSWPISTAPAVAGSAPELSLSYSSGAIDGLGGAIGSGQGDDFGPGWSLDGIGYIERRFKTCTDFPLSTGFTATDLCWAGDNETISFGNRAGELIQVGTTNEFRIKDDPGWRIFKLTGSPGSPGGFWNDPAVGNGLVDDLGEHWAVYTPDGTVYIFGLGYEPASGAPTNSVNAVPVRNATVAGVCINGSVCGRAYRWNLDRKIDRNRNVTTYFWQTEINWYLNPGASGGKYPYASSTHPSRILYGKRSGAENLAPAASVLFSYTNRVASDYPADAVCAPYNNPTNVNCKKAPTFFSTKVTEWIASYLNDPIVAPASSTGVWAHFFTYAPIDVNVTRYFLRYVQRGGWNAAYGVWDPLPSVRFDAINLPNLLDAAPNVEMWRVNQIQDEYGADIRVYYAQPHPCTATYPLPPAVLYNANVWDCFPQWTISLNNNAGFRRFHKYVVQYVDVLDSVSGQPTVSTGSPPMRTAYQYDYDTAGPAGSVRYLGWQYNDDPFLIGQGGITDRRTYSKWKGYPKVTVSQGPVTYPSWAFLLADPTYSWVAPNAKTSAETRYYTGMGGNIYLSDGSPFSYATDPDVFSGRPYEARNLAGPGGIELSGTRTAYTSGTNATSGAKTAQFVGPELQFDRIRKAFAGPFETKQTFTTYNTSSGIVTAVVESGAGVTARCSENIYLAPNTYLGGYNWSTPSGATVETWVADRVATSQIRDGSATNSCTGTVVAKTVNGYNAPADLTSVSRYTNVAGGQALTSSFGYDGYGRVTSMTDPLARTTNGSYSPASGFPATVTITLPAPGLVVTATLDPRFGTVTRAQDNALNNGVAAPSITEAQYDNLGRRTFVRYPGTASTTWDVTYGYGTQGQFAIVGDPMVLPGFGYPKQRTMPIDVIMTARQAGNSVTVPNTYAVTIRTDRWLDGLTRTKEVQTGSPSGGKVVTATKFDGVGRVVEQTAPFYNPGNPWDGLVYASNTPSDTRTVYDGLSRPTAAQTYSLGVFQWQTRFAYDGLATITNPPSPAVTTSKAKDLLGRTVTESGPATMSYTYNARNDVVQIDDITSGSPNVNNRTINVYDDLSRKLSSTDPDQGKWNYGYDNASRLTSRTDGKGQTISYIYDSSDRKTQELNGATSLAEWQYDTSRTGQLYQSCTLTCANANTIRQTFNSYNTRGRPLSVSTRMPASLGFGNPEAGNTTKSRFDYDYTYDAGSGALQSATYPALCTAARETVTTGLNTLGSPERLSGSQTYVSSTTFNNINLLQARSRANAPSIETSFGYDNLQRLTSAQAWAAGAFVFTKYDTIGYDANNNVTSIADNSYLTSQIQCFSYTDGYNRLNAAYTTGTALGTAPSCSAAANGNAPSPYNLTFAYNALGNITTYTGTGTATAAPGTYAYAAPAVSCNGASVTKPHAVTGTSGNAGSYVYDCNGSMTTRTMNGTTQTLAYNVYGRLATVTAGAQVTTNTYDANGQRVIRQNPNGDKTLYLGDVEITKPAAGVISYARNYKLGDETVALRVGTTGGSNDTLQWIVSNQQGSTSIAINNGTTTTSKNSYLPYGGLRGADTITTTDHGFLNQIEDATTGLDYLNARYLDPTLGRFISVDSIIAKTHDAYGYGRNSPLTFSDPTGLYSVDSIEHYMGLDPTGDMTFVYETETKVKSSSDSTYVTTRTRREFDGSRETRFAKERCDSADGCVGSVEPIKQLPPNAPQAGTYGIDAGCWFAFCVQFGFSGASDGKSSHAFFNVAGGLGLSGPGLIIDPGHNNRDKPKESTEFNVNGAVGPVGGSFTYVFKDELNNGGWEHQFPFASIPNRTTTLPKTKWLLSGGASFVHRWRFG
jgi:RHS repeat-associated protein